MRSARGYHKLGVLLAQGACVAVALMFFYGAYTTLKKGFKISEANTLQGAAARILAALFALVGVAIVVFGIFYLPNFAF